MRVRATCSREALGGDARGVVSRARAQGEDSAAGRWVSSRSSSSVVDVPKLSYELGRRCRASRCATGQRASATARPTTRIVVGVWRVDCDVYHALQVEEGEE